MNIRESVFRSMNTHEVMFRNNHGDYVRSHFCAEKDVEFWQKCGYHVRKFTSSLNAWKKKTNTRMCRILELMK